MALQSKSEEITIVNEAQETTASSANNFLRWLLPFKKGVGMYAWILHRLTGLGILAYLFLHLVTISSLTQGVEGLFHEETYLYTAMIFNFLKFGLAIAIIYHGLNGFRVILIDFGVPVKYHKPLFWIFLILGIILIAIAGYLIFTQIEDITRVAA